MKIIKSSRHQKIIADFGENLICNWLSRSGFEVEIVDHTGLDIVAYDPKTKKRLGITVKSRTRDKGTENSEVLLFYYKKETNDRKKLLKACKVFACEPYIAVYVEAADSADVYLTSLRNYDIKYRGKRKKSGDMWRMSKKLKKQYELDPDVKHISITFKDQNWDWK